MLLETIMTHLELLDKTLNISLRIRAYASINETEQAELQLENRTRLVSIITSLQDKIERDLNLLTADKLTPEIIDIVKSWSFDLDNHLISIDKIDQEILVLLENSKVETSKELGTIFTNRNNISGYSQRNVKK